MSGCEAAISFVGTMRNRFKAGDTYESSDIAFHRRARPRGEDLEGLALHSPQLFPGPGPSAPTLQIEGKCGGDREGERPALDAPSPLRAREPGGRAGRAARPPPLSPRGERGLRRHPRAPGAHRLRGRRPPDSDRGPLRRHAARPRPAARRRDPRGRDLGGPRSRPKSNAAVSAPPRGRPKGSRGAAPLAISPAGGAADGRRRSGTRASTAATYVPQLTPSARS